MNASKKEQQESIMERQFRNGTTVKETAVKKLDLASSTLSILGINLHTKKEQSFVQVDSLIKWNSKPP